MSWKDIYSNTNIKSWGLPASSSLTNQGYARGLVLTWSEMQEEFRKLNPAPAPSDAIWYVVCDVLILDDNPIINDQLYIFARRIEIKSDTAFLISPTKTSATIVAQEIMKENQPASLQVSFMPKNEADNPVTLNMDVLENRPATIFTINTPGTLTTEVWSASKSIISNFGDNLSNGRPLRAGMTSVFQASMLISSSNDSELATSLADLKTSPSELAINQLQWVAVITDISEASRVMSGQARAELSWLVKENQGLIVVPPLDFSVYRDAAIARVAVLTSVNSVYEKWVGMEMSNENWLTQANLTVALQSNESTLQTQLEQRAKSKLTIAEGAESEGAAQLVALQNGLVVANFNFEAGVKIWKRKEEISAAFKLVLDIVKFGVEVGKLAAMVAAPGAGESGAVASTGAGATSAGSASASAASSSVAAQEIKVKDLAGPLGETVGAATAVVGDVQKIIEIGKTADAMNSMANDTLKNVDGALDKTFTVSPLKGLDVVTGGKQVWESLLVSMDDMFSRNNDILNTIGGGPEFRIAFKQLVIGGEAYCSTRLAVAEASNSLAVAKLSSAAAEHAVSLAKNSVQVFENNKVLYEQLQQNAFGRIMDAKRAVYLELEQYKQASYYFTLNNEEKALPSITSSVAQFVKESATISGMELILGELSPIPQTLNPFPISLAISESNRTEDTLVVQIDTSNPVFAPYARIRIDKIQIDLLDESENKILVDFIKIGTGGLYRDRIPDGTTSAMFSGNPFIRTLTYNKSGGIILGSNVYARFEDVIFKPTPFTTWSFKLPSKTIAANVSTLKMTITGAASPFS
jgi:hypothetical protein